MDKVAVEKRVVELEDFLMRAQADLYAREEASRTAKGNVAYLVGALEEAKRFLAVIDEMSGADAR